LKAKYYAASFCFQRLFYAILILLISEGMMGGR
jgi:hypothetical protein